jgi:mevalonate pyrophosphate decarboxylase
LHWVQSIKKALQANDFLQLLAIAEENIRNAHQLLEEMDLIVRKPEMLQLCNDISQMRQEGLPGYYLIGGGNLVTIATIDKHHAAIGNYLQEKGWTVYDYKVAGAPKIV